MKLVLEGKKAPNGYTEPLASRLLEAGLTGIVHGPNPHAEKNSPLPAP